ncbi:MULTISPECIES: desulfoferrodoxin [Clostridium]|jgi:superoxide reductase|uniref:Desulfoferrodoxin n=1 Tax=Clostridium sartagoforme AAU1 TaxID=1202534 RepID=R9BSA9_9CLOT|nr:MULTISPECIES: desulfoferrodoxin [Clostridium]EOR19882.1 desulfoferrodoxin [Clostridium sartagoforme AAU1]KLE15154.1 DNA topoisomerase II [Clostridium sp. C8]
MVKKLQVYKCGVCGSMVEVLNEAGGTLVCCGKPMTLLNENTVDAAVEKHIPVAVEENGELLVKVGEVAHPMLDEHFIQWVEVITTEGEVIRKELKPGEKPEAKFNVSGNVDRVREYCNLHGLWSNK